jgi:hypothetical protein
MADWESTHLIDLLNTIYRYLLLRFVSFSLPLPCSSSPRVWSNLCRFILKNGRLSSTKVRGSLLLCSESICLSSRKYDNYPGVARQFCVPTQLATSLGTKHRAVSGPFLLRRERHRQAAIYNGNMNSQSSFVDSSNSYADVARFFDMSTVSASPNSCYVQTPIHNNLHPSTCYNFNNLQHVYSNSHASSAPKVYMPMNNVMNSVNQYEAPNVINFNNMQNNISPFYSSANNLQFFCSPSHMPMDNTICYLISYIFTNWRHHTSLHVNSRENWFFVRTIL